MFKNKFQMIDLPKYFIILTSIFILSSTCFAEGEVKILDMSEKRINWLEKNCVTFKTYSDSPIECSVNKFEQINVSKDHILYYALYRWISTPLQTIDERYDEQPYNNSAIVIFDAGQENTAKPKWAWFNPDGFQFARFEAPVIIKNDFGTILCIPHLFAGTGHFNDDKYFLYSKSQWQRINTSNWLKTLNDKLPKGFGVWKGVTPDIANLSATTHVWEKGDPNCCPSGGKIKIKLGIENQELIVISHDFEVE